MPAWLKRALACVLAAICLYAAARYTTLAKNEAIGVVHKRAQEALRATELSQYIQSFEFGIRYGKRLDSYYNMNGLLEQIRRTSSHIEGACILGPDNAILYQTDPPLEDPSSIRVPAMGSGFYATQELPGYTMLFMDIADADGSRAGRLAVLLNNSMMSALIESYRAESAAQTVVVAAEAFLLAVALLVGAGRGRRRFTPVAAAIIIAAVTFGAQALDVGLEAMKFHAKIDTVTSQSVQKIAQVLQEQVDGVSQKGVAHEDMYDIYGWLRDMRDQLPSVQSLEFTADGHIRADASGEYVNSLTRSFLLMAGRAPLAAAGAGLALCLLAVGVAFVARLGDAEARASGGSLFEKSDAKTF